MSEVAQLTSENEALKAEANSLKEVISRLEAQSKALDQTMREILGANIQLKAGAHLLENHLNAATQNVTRKESEINSLNEQLKAAHAEVQSLSLKIDEMAA